jgi:hypothetical protein
VRGQDKEPNDARKGANLSNQGTFSIIIWPGSLASIKSSTDCPTSDAMLVVAVW